MVIFASMLLVWILLTDRVGPLEILLGILVSAVMAKIVEIPVRGVEILRSIPRMVMAVMKAYVEALQMFKKGMIGEYRVRNRNLDTPWKTVVEVFETTITPKSIVVDIEEDGLLEHVIGSRSKKNERRKMR